MTVLILHLVSCAFMTGLIWVIQILHYPVFELVREESFGEFHTRHSRQITWIVGPVMLFELATAMILIAQAPTVEFYWLNFAGLGLIWIATALLSVPLHNALAVRRDSQKIVHLVRTNWPRTVLWSVRLVMLLAFILAS